MFIFGQQCIYVCQQSVVFVKHVYFFQQSVVFVNVYFLSTMCIFVNNM